MTDDGQTILGVIASRPVLWSNGQQVPRQIAGQGYSASLISGDGTAILGEYFTGRSNRPILWHRDHDAIDLERYLRSSELANEFAEGSVFIFTSLTAVDGRIMLVGTEATDSQRRGFLVTLTNPVPEPASVIGLSLMLAGLAVRHNRRRP